MKKKLIKRNEKPKKPIEILAYLTMVMEPYTMTNMIDVLFVFTIKSRPFSLLFSYSRDKKRQKKETEMIDTITFPVYL